MTLAWGIDVVLYRKWRRSYFLCKPDSPAILAGLGVQVPFRDRWVALLAGTPGGSHEFLAGIAAWTLGRLASHDRAFVWADRPIRWYTPEYRRGCYDDVVQSLGSTVGLGRWMAHLDGESHANVLVIETVSEDFPSLLAAYFLFASQSCNEIWFATGDGREAYQIHHHDKVVISVPDAAARGRILEDFLARPELYEDASDYELEMEAEDMTEEEWWEGA